MKIHGLFALVLTAPAYHATDAEDDAMAMPHDDSSSSAAASAAALLGPGLFGNAFVRTRARRYDGDRYLLVIFLDGASTV